MLVVRNYREASWTTHFKLASSLIDMADQGAWLSCLWALTNNVQKRKEKRKEKGGFSNFIITLSFLVQFT